MPNSHNSYYQQSHCLGCFFCCCVKTIPLHSLTVPVHYCGKVKQQELEATSHITAMVRKQRRMNVQMHTQPIGPGLHLWKWYHPYTRQVFPPQHDQNSPPHADICTNKLPNLVNPSLAVSSQVVCLTTKTNHNSFETQRYKDTSGKAQIKAVTTTKLVLQETLKETQYREARHFPWWEHRKW